MLLEFTIGLIAVAGLLVVVALISLPAKVWLMRVSPGLEDDSTFDRCLAWVIAVGLTGLVLLMTWLAIVQLRDVGHFLLTQHN